MALDSPGLTESAAPEPATTSTPIRGYPVNIIYERPPYHRRFWAIPILGALVKGIILIPHYLVLYPLGAIVSVSLLVLWLPVLLGGKYPLWGYALLGGTIRWTTRVTAFFLGLTDEYPPFTFRSSREDGQLYQVQVQVEIPDRSSRWWAFPALGLAVKLLILLPHVVALALLGNLIYLVSLGLWIPVLVTGRYPDWSYQLVGGTIRWSTRVTAYTYGLTDRYPPFSFD